MPCLISALFGYPFHVTRLRPVDRPTINQLVTSRRGSKRIFLAGLVQAGIRASTAMLADLQASSEGLDHSRWSGSRAVYCGWAAETLAALAQVGAGFGADLR